MVRKLEADGWVVYPSSIDSCPECDGEIVRQRKVSGVKEIDGEEMRIKGMRCKECGDDFVVSDAVTKH